MSAVLVTGGTGRLGSLLVGELAGRGHDVRILSRRPGAGHVVGDLATGAGIEAAVTGADVVVHAATGVRTKAVDVRGTGRLTRAAASARVDHVVYVSIVGVDRNPFRYYRAKLAAEGIVESSGLPYTLARGTQFYDLVATIAAKLHVGPLLFAPRGWRVEPHAPADFARSLADRVDAGPTGGVTEFGGPQQFDAAELVASWHNAHGSLHKLSLDAHGHGGKVRELPLPGRVSAAWRAGAQVSAAQADRGTTTWDEWLRAGR